MTYLLICVPFLVTAALVFAISMRRMPRAARRRRWAATGLATAGLLVLTAVFDSVMIAAGLFAYADGTRLGPTVWLAPIEDFAYPLAAVLLVPAVWSLATRRAGGPKPVDSEGRRA